MAFCPSNKTFCVLEPEKRSDFGEYGFPLAPIPWHFAQIIRQFERERELSATTRWYIPQICDRTGRNYSETYVPMSGLPIFLDSQARVEASTELSLAFRGTQNWRFLGQA